MDTRDGKMQGDGWTPTTGHEAAAIEARMKGATTGPTMPDGAVELRQVMDRLNPPITGPGAGLQSPVGMGGFDHGLFVKLFGAMQRHVHETAVEKGWWDPSEDLQKAVDMLRGWQAASGVLTGEGQRLIDRLIDHVHATNIGEKIALMHSELSEGLEGARKDLPSDHIQGFSMLEEELADAIIRIMDLAAKEKLRVAEAIVAKATFNRTRPHRHGGKKF